jgi:ATP-dependent helicase/nuclease subunit B
VSDLDLLYRRGTTKGARALAAIGTGVEIEPVASLWQLSASPHALDLGAARRLIRAMVATASLGASCGDADLEDDARAFRALDGALDALAKMEAGDAEGAVGDGRSLVDWRTALGSLGSMVVAPQREQPGAVQVLSVQRARARRFPVVFVLGLVEGEFPGRADRPSLLSPSQRSRLDRVAGGLFAEDVDDEAALFMSALSRASRLLYLSTRDAEDDGAEATPSYFWTRAKDLLGQGQTEPLTRTLGDQVFSPSTAPTLRHYERGCVAAGLGLSPVGLQRALPSWDRRPGALCDPQVIAELAATQRFSPSALESYAKCPFAWFVQKIVGADELEIEMDGRQIGQLLHSALSATYQELEASGLLPLRAGLVAVAQTVAGRKIDGLVNGADCPGTIAERRLAAWQLRRMVDNLFDMEVAADWPLVPHELEVWVGSRCGVDVGGFKVHGRVDRVDATRDRRGQFVIDYKSGNIPANSAIGGKEGLQLPLYLMAMAAERPRSAILGGAYLGLSDKKRSGIAVEGAEQLLGDAVQGCRVLDQTAMEELLQKTVDISRQAVEGMRSGVIAPRDDRSCPPWCSLAPACRARKGGYRA